MKAFENQTYYEILKVPVDADLGAVKQAYREALDTYSEDALATYSLFSEDERTELLQTIETAFHTLVDPGKRAVYDQMLLNSGQDAARQQQLPGEAAAEPPERPEASRPPDIRTRVETKFGDEEIQRMAEQLVAKDLISGLDLKRLREALGVDLGEIFELTRISKTTLTNIEENEFSRLPAEVFLKSFLKSYAEILQIDPQRVIEGYYKYISLSDR